MSRWHTPRCVCVCCAHTVTNGWGGLSSYVLACCGLVVVLKLCPGACEMRCGHDVRSDGRCPRALADAWVADGGPPSNHAPRYARNRDSESRRRSPTAPDSWSCSSSRDASVRRDDRDVGMWLWWRWRPSVASRHAAESRRSDGGRPDEKTAQRTLGTRDTGDTDWTGRAPSAARALAWTPVLERGPLGPATSASAGPGPAPAPGAAGAWHLGSPDR